MTTLEETLIATAKTYMQVFTSLDPEDILPIQTDDYQHTIAPTSLGFTSPYTRAQFATHILGLRRFLSSFPVHSRQVWPNPTKRQVLIWAQSEANFHEFVKGFGEPDSSVSWTFKGEYMWLLTMNNKGNKVKQVLEFLDSKGAEQMKTLIGKALERIGPTEPPVESNPQ